MKPVQLSLACAAVAVGAGLLGYCLGAGAGFWSRPFLGGAMAMVVGALLGLEAIWGVERQRPWSARDAKALVLERILATGSGLEDHGTGRADPHLSGCGTWDGEPCSCPGRSENGRVAERLQDAVFIDLEVS